MKGEEKQVVKMAVAGVTIVIYADYVCRAL